MNCSDFTGKCAHCDRRLGLTVEGVMTAHGPAGSRCPGSGAEPIHGSIESRGPASRPGPGEPVLSPPPPGTSADRWDEVVHACRQMDERANVRAATGPAKFLS